MKPEQSVSLTPGKRVLFLTRDPDLIRRQLAGTLDLKMEDVRVGDLMDDVNTDAMTPAWACFDYDPAKIARNAYAGITVDKERLFPEGSLMAGNFEVIVSGYRKGVGSSRETAVQAEKWSGIRIAIAASFAPIHARNNVSQGVLMGDHAMLARLQRGERIPLEEFARGYDPITRMVIEHGGLFPFTKAFARGEVALPKPETGARPMTIAEKVLAAHVLGAEGPVYVKPGDAVSVRVDGGYSHEFTTAQVHYFLEQEYGPGYALANPQKFAVFEDHLIYADGVAKMAPFSPKIQVLRDMQRLFQSQTGVQDYSARDGVSPGICHTVARERLVEPGDFIQATDSHTCMGGANNALAYGVGATEYAALVHSGFTFVEVPESIRFELVGRLPAGVTAKDVMLFILAEYARKQMTLDRVMEFGGPGLRTLSPDERATLTNMATECSAKAGVTEADDEMLEWMAARRPGASVEALRRRTVAPDPGAEYAGGVHTIDLATMRPMVATPGDPAHGVPSDPTNGAWISDLGEVPIDIAYGGSCTAGKEVDLDLYALPEPQRHRLAIAMIGEMLSDWRYQSTANVGWFKWVRQRAQYWLVTALFNVFPLPQQSGFRRSFAFAGESLGRGYNVLVFPEGRRSTIGQMYPFMSGIGLLVKQLGIPVVPVRIDGLYQLKEEGRHFARPGQVTIRFGQPVKFDADRTAASITAELEERVRSV